MKAISLQFCILALLCLPVLADQASKEAKVEELFKLMRLERALNQTMEIVMGQMKASAMQRLLGLNMPGELQQEVELLQREMGTVLDRHMGWNAIKADYLQIYGEAFSEEELDAILAFYRTPAGQALVERQPQMMERSAVVVQRKMEQATPEVQAMLAAWMEKMKARTPPRQ